MLRLALLCCLAALLTGCSDLVVAERPRPPARPCVSPAGVANVSFSRTRYPNILRHYRAAVAEGWPRVLVLNRLGAHTRRTKLLRRIATRD